MHQVLRVGMKAAQPRPPAKDRRIGRPRHRADANSRRATARENGVRAEKQWHELSRYARRRTSRMRRHGDAGARPGADAGTRNLRSHRNAVHEAVRPVGTVNGFYQATSRGIVAAAAIWPIAATRGMRRSFRRRPPFSLANQQLELVGCESRVAEQFQSGLLRQRRLDLRGEFRQVVGVRPRAPCRRSSATASRP